MLKHPETSINNKIIGYLNSYFQTFPSVLTFGFSRRKITKLKNSQIRPEKNKMLKHSETSGNNYIKKHSETSGNKQKKDTQERLEITK